MSTSDDQS